MPTKIMSKVMAKPNFLSIKYHFAYLLVPFLKLAKEPSGARAQGRIQYSWSKLYLVATHVSLEDS
jgi:hypothetical protein